MPKNGVDAIGDESMVVLFRVRDFMGEIGLGSEESQNSQKSGKDGQNKSGSHEKMVWLFEWVRTL